MATTLRHIYESFFKYWLRNIVHANADLHVNSRSHMPKAVRVALLYIIRTCFNVLLKKLIKFDAFWYNSVKQYYGIMSVKLSFASG